MKSYFGSALMVAGAALGYISAIQAISISGQEPVAQHKHWQKQTALPSSGYAIYAKDHYRQNGQLPPPRNVQVFTRSTDEDGVTLRSDCIYIFTSKAPKARWWSLATHGADMVHTTNSGEVFITGQNDLIIALAKEHQPGNWLAAPQANSFTVSFVLIEPVTDQKQFTFLPTLKKDSCS